MNIMCTLDEFKISQESFENDICGSILWIMRKYHVYTTQLALNWIIRLRYDSNEQIEWREYCSLSYSEILNYCRYYADYYRYYEKDLSVADLCGIMDEIIFKKLIDKFGDEIDKMIDR